MKKIIATIMAATVISGSAMACTPRYKDNGVGNVMAQVRVQAVKAGAAVKTSDNSYLQAALAAAAKAGAAAAASVDSGK